MLRRETTNYQEYAAYLDHPRPCYVCGSNNKKEWARDGIFTAVQCQNCSFVWMDPRLNQAGLQKYYDNYIQFRLEDAKKMQQRDRMYELDRDFLEQFVKTGRVLDVGCSAGYFLEKLSDTFDKYGIEVDEKAVALAKERSPLRDRIKQAILGAGTDGFEPGSFDVVVMRGVIEHLPDPAAAFARVSELLKEGGHFFITATPNVDSFCADLYREKWNLWDPFQHVSHFSAKTLERLGRTAGLSLRSQSYPYLETPYANQQEDHEKVLNDYALIKAGRGREVTASPAFWGNMLTVLFQKVDRPTQARVASREKYEFFRDPDRCYVIAEAGLNHNGSLAIAKKLIDVAAVAGVDAVKFQKRTVADLAVQTVLDAADTRFPDFGQTYQQIREHLEFGWDEYVELKRYCEERGLDFLCTAFDIPAANFLDDLGVDSYKLASHSLTNIPLLEYIARLGKLAIVSTGMCEMSDIDIAVDIFKKQSTPLVLMHCVSAYPTPMDQCNLAMIDILHKRYGVPVGYSGHELGMLPTLTSVARGASAVERHFTLDKTMPGFDHKISLEPDELISMVRSIRAIKQTMGSGQKHISETEKITLAKYHVSMVSARDIPAGTVLTPDMITYKNPGTGIAPKDAHFILGKVALQDIPADTLLSLAMVR